CKFLAGGNLVLLAAGFYDRVHERLRLLVWLSLGFPLKKPGKALNYKGELSSVSKPRGGLRRDAISGVAGARERVRLTYNARGTDPLDPSPRQPPRSPVPAPRRDHRIPAESHRRGHGRGRPRHARVAPIRGRADSTSCRLHRCRRREATAPRP